MRITFLLFFIIFSTLNGFSQFETPKKVISIAPIKSDNAPIQNSSENKIPTVIKFESSIGKNEDKTFLNGFSLLPKKEEKSLMVKEPVRTAGELWEKKVKGTLKGERDIQTKFKSDTFLGDFKSETKVVKIACRDHEYPDGDIVRIWLNDKVAVNSILLTEDFTSVYLELNEGINKIEIEALNQGESGPNTAQFVIVDDKGHVITNNKWNLLTGAKAKMVVTKVDAILR